jgi:hypothetical protein
MLYVQDIYKVSREHERFNGRSVHSGDISNLPSPGYLISITDLVPEVVIKEIVFKRVAFFT